jgi:hypothetical protein
LRQALLDRLTHYCHIFEMNGESCRFKQSLQKSNLKKKLNCVCVPPVGGLLCNQGVADLHAYPWLFWMPITTPQCFLL